MKQTKVTDIAIKPSAEGLIASMEAQLKNPKSNQKWDSPFKRRWRFIYKLSATIWTMYKLLSI